MYILQIASELAPIAKVGGLGDVLYGLSKELCRQGHTVEILIPKYDCLQFAPLTHLKVEHRELWTQEGEHRYNNTIWSAKLDGLNLLLLEPHHPLYYFSRGVIYGCHDDIDRFAYFSRAATEYLFRRGKRPNILHVHDWPTALIPLLCKELHPNKKTKTVLTLHNMEHQGKCSPEHLTRIGLKAKNYHTPEKLQDPLSPLLVNFLKGGIEYADQITTVSPNYEREIQTAEGGFGLQETLLKTRKKLKGILNGIDEDFWNPEKDPHLIQNYATHALTEKELPKVLKAKQENKEHLRMHLHLQPTSTPLVACVSRLVPQKSPELIAYALKRTLELGGQFILLGSTPLASIKETFESLQEKYADAPNVTILLDQDEALAHLFFAAADMFIIPSLFEPCGLTQLIALRYATVPLVRRTGGLKDTVHDIDTSSRPFEDRNGFTFDFADSKGVDWVLERALKCYREDRQRWQALLLNGTRRDFSWKKSTQEYIELYEKPI